MIKKNRTNNANTQEEKEEEDDLIKQQQQVTPDDVEKRNKMERMKTAFAECFYPYVSSRGEQYKSLVYPEQGKQILQGYIGNIYISKQEFSDMMTELGHTPFNKRKQYKFMCKHEFYNKYWCDLTKIQEMKKKRRKYI